MKRVMGVALAMGLVSAVLAEEPGGIQVTARETPPALVLPGVTEILEGAILVTAEYRTADVALQAIGNMLEKKAAPAGGGGTVSYGFEKVSYGKGKSAFRKAAFAAPKDKTLLGLTLRLPAKALLDPSALADASPGWKFRWSGGAIAHAWRFESGAAEAGEKARGYRLLLDDLILQDGSGKNIGRGIGLRLDGGAFLGGEKFLSMTWVKPAEAETIEAKVVFAVDTGAAPAKLQFRREPALALPEPSDVKK